MATESNWSNYANQAHLKDSDTILAQTASGAGVEIAGVNVMARRVNGGPFEGGPFRYAIGALTMYSDVYGVNYTVAASGDGSSVGGWVRKTSLLKAAPNATDAVGFGCLGQNASVSFAFWSLGSGEYNSAYGVRLTRTYLAPQSDNTIALGNSYLRWSNVYAASGAISTSDKRHKTEIGAIPDEWLDAWADVEWCRFKYRDGNRWHTGLIAQDVHAAFAEHGIDAFEIGLCCYNSLDDEYAPVMATRDVTKTRKVKHLQKTGEKPVKQEIVLEIDGVEKKAAINTFEPIFETVEVEETYIEQEEYDTGEKKLIREKGDIWSLRYDEAFAIEAAYQRREISRRDAVIADLRTEIEDLKASLSS